MVSISQGEDAPDFALPDKDGDTHSLAEFRGNWLVLYFYPRDNTSGCTKEALDFSDLIEDFKRLNATVVGISPDSPESHGKFIEKYGLKVMLLSDQDKTVMKKYGAIGLKKNYGREYEGVIRTTFLISPDGKIAEVWKNVKVRKKKKSGEEKHAEVVLNTLIKISGSEK